MLVLAVPLAVTVIVAWIAIQRTRTEPRRLSNAYWLLGAAILVLGLAVIILPNGGVIFVPIIVTMIMSPILIVVLAAFLILNGIEILRKERLAPAHLLSLLAGVGMLALTIGAIPVILSANRWVIWGYTVLLLAASYLGFQFFAFLGYSLLYQRIVKRLPASWVVVLGSGLGSDGQVTPLLASRIRTGMLEFSRRGAEKLIMSGGQGEDEPTAEATAMAAWAVDHGAQPAQLETEDRSRNTEQNLRYTAELLPSRGEELQATPGLIVTSNYHTMRAAILARKVGLPAQASGAPTAGYYWPSAMLREFVAILAENRLAHVVLAGLVALPVPTLLVLVGG